MSEQLLEDILLIRRNLQLKLIQKSECKPATEKFDLCLNKITKNTKSY